MNTDNMNTDNMNTDNMNTENMNTDNMNTDNMNTDNMNTDNMNTRNIACLGKDLSVNGMYINENKENAHKKITDRIEKTINTTYDDLLKSLEDKNPDKLHIKNIKEMIDNHNRPRYFEYNDAIKCFGDGYGRFLLHYKNDIPRKIDKINNGYTYFTCRFCKKNRVCKYSGIQYEYCIFCMPCFANCDLSEFCMINHKMFNEYAKFFSILYKKDYFYICCNVCGYGISCEYSIYEIGKMVIYDKIHDHYNKMVCELVISGIVSP